MKLFIHAFMLCLCVCAALSLAPTAYAFDLFNQDRGKQPEPPPAPPPPTPPPPAPPPPIPPPPPPQQDFSLQGTSQLGAMFHILLTTPENQTAKIKWTAGTDSLELGYGFRLLHVTPRTLTVAYPEASPCREDRQEKGVDCSPDGKTATLGLVLGKPTPPKAAPVAQLVQPVMSNSPQSPPPPVDEAQAEAARERARQAFQGAMANTINPDAVPPGMRIVKTPFGDRLVPIKK